jgi:SHS family lactate transporter-like MFS transporter
VCLSGYDYFSVSLTATRLATYFHKSTTDITTAITLTLLFRSIGAVLFGVLSDRFGEFQAIERVQVDDIALTSRSVAGRKWTLVVNLLLVAVFELGSSFCTHWSAFLAVRSLFGVAMGGIWCV